MGSARPHLPASEGNAAWRKPAGKTHGPPPSGGSRPIRRRVASRGHANGSGVVAARAGLSSGGQSRRSAEPAIAPVFRSLARLRTPRDPADYTLSRRFSLDASRHVGEDVQECGRRYRRECGRTKSKTSRSRKAQTAVALESGASAADCDHSRPDVILFNGGFFASPVLRERLLEVVKGWFPSKSKIAWSPIALDHERLDLLAVALERHITAWSAAGRWRGARLPPGLART